MIPLGRMDSSRCGSASFLLYYTGNGACLERLLLFSCMRTNGMDPRKGLSSQTVCREEPGMTEAMERLQRRIDELERRMRLDSNDLDYETHRKQKRELQGILDRMKQKARRERG